MGYTNYWKKEMPVNAEVQERYQIACERIAEFIGEEANDPDSYWAISLSGECEDFALPHRISDIQKFNFCKTNRHDYDREVMGSIFILKHYVPEITIQSDGQNSDGTVELIVGEAYSAYFDFMEYLHCTPKSLSELFGEEIVERIPAQEYLFVDKAVHHSLTFDHITKEFTVTAKRDGIEESVWVGDAEELIDVILNSIKEA